MEMLKHASCFHEHDCLFFFLYLGVSKGTIPFKY